MPRRRAASAASDTAPASSPLRANRLLVERSLNDGIPAAPGRRREGAHCAVRSVTVNLSESPLGWLMARGHLSVRQFDAGEKLRGDYEAAQLSSMVSSRWDPVPSDRLSAGAGCMLERSERQVAAKQRFDAALDALGTGLDAIAWRIICQHQSIPDAERALGWPARAGKLVLRIALDRLADHYRLPGG